MDLSLGFLFCSTDLYFCLCATTILSWWLWLCSIAWSQAGWFLQFHSSFSRLLWLFEFFCISIQTEKLFVLVLLLKTMGCFSGQLVSSASDQNLFCEVPSAFNCSFNELFGEEVVSLSYSSTILALPLICIILIYVCSTRFHPSKIYNQQFLKICYSV